MTTLTIVPFFDINYQSIFYIINKGNKKKHLNSHQEL